MRCIILCAGYAIRLHPLTLNKPKPLLEIAGKPLIEHILLRVEEIEDIKEIFIVTNNKFYPDFVRWLAKYSATKRISIINDMTKSNEERLGAVGDINFVVKKEKPNDDILVIAGDNLFEFSLTHLVAFFSQKRSSVVTLLDVVDKGRASKKYGVVELDNAMRIAGFEEKPGLPKTSLISTACYIFSREDINELENYIREHKKHDNLGDFIKHLADKKNVYGLVFVERWFDIGSHEELREADIAWRRK